MIVTTLIALALTIVAGVLLGYQPDTTGTFGVANGYGSGKIATEYVFQLRVAAGYWLIGVVMTAIICLLCIPVRKAFIHKHDNNVD